MSKKEKKSFLKGALSVLKIFFFVISVLTQLSYISLLVYLSTVVDERQAVNISLLVFSIIYLIIYIVLSLIRNRDVSKAKTTAKRAYKTVKFLLRFISIGITIYGIYFTSKHFSLISAILAGASLHFLINELIIEIVSFLIAREAKKLKQDVTDGLNDIVESVKSIKLPKIKKKVKEQPLEQNSLDNNQKTPID